MQRIISDSCFQLKSRFNVDARALSIPLLNFPFNNIWFFILYSQTVDGQFILSFTYRFEFRFSTVYFAFCYPYSYTEYQDKLGELDNKFAGRKYDPGW